MNYLNQKLNGTITTIRSSGSYTILKKHNLNLSLAFLSRAAKTTQASNNSDFTANLGYSYAF
jgi:hypothetical protein